MVNETDEYQSEEGDTDGNAGSISTAQKKKNFSLPPVNIQGLRID